jgi:hypothetical protein
VATTDAGPAETVDTADPSLVAVTVTVAVAVAGPLTVLVTVEVDGAAVLVVGVPVPPAVVGGLAVAVSVGALRACAVPTASQPRAVRTTAASSAAPALQRAAGPARAEGMTHPRRQG